MGYISAFYGPETIPWDSRDTISDPHRVQDPTWSFNGPYRDPKMDQMIFEKIPGFVHLLYIVHSAALLNILENFFGHCGTLPGPRGPSWTAMDPHGPPNGPQNGPCEANFRGPLVEKGPPGSLHGPN